MGYSKPSINLTKILINDPHSKKLMFGLLEDILLPVPENFQEDLLPYITALPRDQQNLLLRSMETVVDTTNQDLILYEAESSTEQQRAENALLARCSLQPYVFFVQGAEKEIMYCKKQFEKNFSSAKEFAVLGEKHQEVQQKLAEGYEEFFRLLLFKEISIQYLADAVSIIQPETLSHFKKHLEKAKGAAMQSLFVLAQQTKMQEYLGLDKTIEVVQATVNDVFQKRVEACQYQKVKKEQLN